MKKINAQNDREVISNEEEYLDFYIIIAQSKR